MHYNYSVYNLVIRTTFPCPALLPAPDDVEPDVTVVEGEVPRSLEAPLAADTAWEAELGRFLWRGGRKVGRFLVERGSQITLQRTPECQEDRLSFHFQTSALAALMRQRGHLVLHANSVILPGGDAVALSGDSGAGKSTTLTALLQHGCKMLSDDITVLQFGEDGIIEALPGIIQTYLTEEAALALGVKTESLTFLPWRRMKAAVPMLDFRNAHPARLKSIYLLSPVDNIPSVTLHQFSGTERFETLLDSIYGPLLPEESPGIFTLKQAMMAQVPVWRIERPTGSWSVDQIVEAIIGG